MIDRTDVASAYIFFFFFLERIEFFLVLINRSNGIPWIIPSVTYVRV